MNDSLALSALRRLNDELPLPKGWGPIEPFVETVELDELRVHTVGLLSSSGQGTEVTGSAACVAAPPVERAYFELLERVAIVEARQSARQRCRVVDRLGKSLGSLPRDEVFPEASSSEWRYALSSGVAAARTVGRAILAARAELVERDRVLRSWFGGPAPVRRARRSSDDWCPASSHEVEVYSFSSDDPNADLVVAGVFAFPKLGHAPLAYGLAAAGDLETAIERAGGECQQRLAFLWGEPLPDGPPPFEPTPAYHQDFYLNPKSHARLRAWLRGGHSRGTFASSKPRQVRARFIDLTPEHLLSQVWVVKALPNDELPLTFGRGHPDLAPVLHRYGVHPIA